MRLRCSRSNPSLTATAAVLALTLLAYRSPACASLLLQQPPPASNGLSDSPPVPDDAAIQARIAELEQLGDLDEPARTELALLKEAHEFLQNAAEASQRTGALEELIAGAPEQVQSIQQQLEQPLDDRPIDFAGDVTLDSLRSRLAQAQADIEAQRTARQQLEQEAADRDARRTEFPNLAGAARTRLDEINAALATPVPGDPADRVAEARLLRLQAERAKLQSLLRRYELEQRSDEPQRELLRLRRQLAERSIRQAEVQAELLRNAVTDKQRQAAAEAEQAALAARLDAANDHELVQEIALENQRLAKQALNLSPRIADASADLQQARRLLSSERLGFETIQERVKLGVSEELGRMLRLHDAALPDTGELRMRLADRDALIGRARLERLEQDRRQLNLVDLESEIDRRMNAFQSSIDDAERDVIRQAMRTQLEEQRSTYLPTLIQAYDLYIDSTLTELDQAERDLLALVDEYRTFIRERILWVRSATPLYEHSYADQLEGFKWLFSLDHWGTALRATWRQAMQRPLPPIAGAVLIALLLALKPALVRRLQQIALDVSRPSTDTFARTLVAAAISVLLALPGPLLLLLAGWGLRLDSAASAEAEFTGAIAAGLYRTGTIWFAINLVGSLCRPGGLAEAHFRWRPHNLQLTRRHIRWFAPLILPLAFLFNVFAEALTGATELNPRFDAAAQLCFLLSMVVCAVVAYRILHPRTGVLRDIISRHSGGWLDRLKMLWFPSIVLAILALGGLAAAGYAYTAQQLERRAVSTAWLVLAVVVANAFLVRWLLLAQRTMAIAQLRKVRAARAEGESARPASTSGPGSAVPEPSAIDDMVVDVSEVSAQSRQLLRSAAYLIVLFGIWIIWVDVLPALSRLREIELWSRVVDVASSVSADGGTGALRTIQQTFPITIADLLLAVFVAIATFVVATNIPGLLEITVLQNLPLGRSRRYAITTITRYVITIAGMVTAFGILGITWSKVQWLAAAITVGLGFGLQEIFANFVSGLIILFEQPIRVGDTVTVGTMEGTVSRIRMRATTIVDWNRKEFIIPNKEFVTGSVVNWTLTDQITRVVIPLGIAYGSDVPQAKALLLQLARDHPDVLKTPEPRALFQRFGESALDLELRVFVPTVDHMLAVRDDLNSAIDRAFRKAGIDIAFPQRDIHIRSINAVLPIETRDDGLAPRDGAAALDDGSKTMPAKSDVPTSRL